MSTDNQHWPFRRDTTELTGTETSIVEKTVSSTESRDGNVLVPEVLLGHTLNLGGGDGVDVSLDFSGGVSLAGGDHLSANLLCIIGVSGVKNRGKTRTSSAMAVVPSRPSRREALSWDFARSTSAMVGLIDIRVHSLSVKWVRSSTFMRLARRSAGKAGNGTGDRLFRNKVDTPETGVRVGSGEGHVRVGKVVAGDDVGQPAAQEGARAQRPVPVTKDALHDEHGPVVGRLPSDTLDGDGEVDGVHRVVADADFGADKLGGGVGLAAEGDGVGGHGEGGKVLFGELDEGVVLDGAGADEGHPVGGVVFGNVGLEVRLGNRVDVFLGAEDGVSERGAWQGSAKQRGVGGRRTHPGRRQSAGGQRRPLHTASRPLPAPSESRRAPAQSPTLRAWSVGECRTGCRPPGGRPCRTPWRSRRSARARCRR